jgi:carbamate kinase
VVPSPEPRRLVELAAIRLLVEAGSIVICAGGGGIPVARNPDGTLGGVEAVVDKDLASALLATDLGADALLLLTDVAAVCTDWGTHRPKPLRSAGVGYLRAQSFPSGSMGPKVEAACRFVEATGATAAVGAIGEAAAVLRGQAGTTVIAGTDTATWWDPGGTQG